LGENADRNSVRLWLGDDRLKVDWVGEPDSDGFRQINAQAPEGLTAGMHTLRASFGESEATGAAKVRVAGAR
jgi:hypothetical protein